ncbi:MAG TPA: YidB family protein [Steroidobacteraceae bacterium]|nr:YidB family protein [Steroidobacteraceae bacterium]
MGLLAYRTLKGKGKLADMLGTNQTGTNQTGSDVGNAPAGGGLGGVLGGGSLGAGLKDLLDRFRQSGQEEKVQSWVSTGSNKPIAPNEIEQALGEERLQWLVEQTGMPRDQLLNGLSGELPQAIDKLTPDGRLPTDEELSRLQ